MYFMEGLSVSIMFCILHTVYSVFSRKCTQRAFRTSFADEKILDKKIYSLCTTMLRKDEHLILVGSLFLFLSRYFVHFFPSPGYECLMSY